MLVLTRKSGESIRIGSNIVVTILDHSTGQMKIGIDAPMDIPIHREEVYTRIQEENKSALISQLAGKNLLEQYMKGK